MKLEILDSVTLQKLRSLDFPVGRQNESLAFSPDSHVLTSSSSNWGVSLVVSWDLQTGGVAGVIRHASRSNDTLVDRSIVYSTNGKMIAVLRHGLYASTITISIYDVVSYKHMHDVHLTSNAPPGGLWVCGESFRFATIDNAAFKTTGPMTITIWEVGFTPGATKTEVETLSIPESVKLSGFGMIGSSHSMIYPNSLSAPFLITNTPFGNDVLVWDARNSKILLRRQDANPFSEVAFSSDGRFFAGSFSGSGVYIWKHSPTGYVPLGKLTSSTPTRNSRLLFSPNGETVILFSGSVLNLWHTENFAGPLPDNFVYPPHQTNPFLFELLPDRSLAAVVRHGDSTVTVFDIGSGSPQLTIDAGVKVNGLGVTEDAVVVISGEEVITWKLPGRGFLPGVTMSATDSALTVGLLDSRQYGGAMRGSISLDLRFVVVGVSTSWSIHSATTGECLSDIISPNIGMWLTSDGHHIGDMIDEKIGRIRRITAEGAVEKPATIIDLGEEQWGCPYKSSRYRIGGDGWLFGPNNNRLLVLPPLWRLKSCTKERKWNGQILALLHGVLPEPVVIDLEP